MNIAALNYYKSNPGAAYAAGGAYIAKQGSNKAVNYVKNAKQTAKIDAIKNNTKTTGGAYIAAQGSKKYKNQYVAAWAAKWAN